MAALLEDDDPMAARLVLEDGSVYRGRRFGAAKSVPGEVGAFSVRL